MRRYIKANFLFIVCLFFSSGCSNDNQGFPDEIIFPANGRHITLHSESAVYWGCISVSGERPITDIEYKDNEPDSIILRNEWLTIKGRIGEKKLSFTATDKKTVNDALNVSIHFDPEPEAIIKVKRK